MTGAANVYAQAMYDLARDEGCCENVLRDLSVLSGCIAAEPKFLRLLSAPNLSKEERCGIVDDSFRGKVHPYVLNFMKVLTEKGYMRCFSDCAKAYRRIYNRDHGILEVTAITAVALTEDQIARLTQKLHKVTGKTVDLYNRVEARCMGGVRLDYDGKRVDDTVANRLRTIGDLLKNTVL